MYPVNNCGYKRSNLHVKLCPKHTAGIGAPSSLNLLILSVDRTKWCAQN